MPDRPLFPTTVAINLGCELPDTFRTIRPGAEAGTLIALRRWDAPKMRGGRLKLLCNQSTLEDVREFWAAGHGGGTIVDFRYPWPDVWYGLLIGVGDGVTDLFEIPGYDTESVTVYKDGVEVAGADLTLSAGTGENDRDQVHFDVAAPAAGVIITADFTGQRMIECLLGDELNVIERGPGTFAVSMSLDEV